MCVAPGKAPEFSRGVARNSPGRKDLLAAVLTFWRVADYSSTAKTLGNCLDTYSNSVDNRHCIETFLRQSGFRSYPCDIALPIRF